MDDNTVTIVGNLTADPMLKFTASGAAVSSFRLAQTPRYFDKASGQWRDGDSLFVTVTCWRGLAENVASSMRRGDRVLVKGRLRQREFEAVPGEHKSVIEIEADLVGPELARAIATPRKVSRDAVPGGDHHPGPPGRDLSGPAGADVLAELIGDDLAEGPDETDHVGLAGDADADGETVAA